MNKSKRIFIVAVESSADQLGAELIEQLQEQANGPIDIAGLGGKAMAARGVQSDIDTSAIAVLGLWEGVRAYPAMRRILRQTMDEILEFKPDCLVCIDSWGFTLRVAQQVQKLAPECKRVKYVGPQVFATRPGRAKTCAQAYDHLLTIHSFDAPFFEDEGLAVSYVGNPVLFTRKQPVTENFRKDYALENKPVLSVLFGSREAEFRLLKPVFLDCIDLLKQQIPDLQVFSPLADNLATMIRAEAASDARLMEIGFIHEAEGPGLFSQSDAALVCSGTASLEIAMAGLPMVIGYKLGRISGFLLEKFMFKAEFANLINLSAKKEIIPEFLQSKCHAAALSKALVPLIVDGKAQEAQRHLVSCAISKMKSGISHPGVKAAQSILDLLD